jgi:hypothetical protein
MPEVERMGQARYCVEVYEVKGKFWRYLITPKEK